MSDYPTSLPVRIDQSGAVRVQIIGASGENLQPGGILDLLCSQFEALNARITHLEKRLLVPKGTNLEQRLTDVEFLESLYGEKPVGIAYTAEQVKSPDEQKMSIERFKQAFSQTVNKHLENVCKPVDYVPLPAEKKEEPHPATQTSFVLKI
jgi:tRNA(Met) C34 N-acetyltransferase TmcA